jgi:Exo-beta-D-glucosaminidase Ig-fold domain/Concanavalin A-like lectin/glucanases superfamily/Glycosyl hydrolases family 2/Glycosyl hydrolases family 2, sugar binding domain
VNVRSSAHRRWVAAIWTVLALAGTAIANPENNFGPYNLRFLEGSIGFSRPLAQDAALLAPNSPWSLGGWVRSEYLQPGEVVVAAVGSTADAQWRGLALTDGALSLVLSADRHLRSSARLEPGRWYAVAASYDGHQASLYLDGSRILTEVSGTGRVAPRLELAPVIGSTEPRAHFGGSLASFSISAQSADPASIASQAAAAPNFSLVTFTAVGVGWPFQEHAWRGLQVPQDAWTLPQAKTPASAPIVTPAPTPVDLQARGPGQWALGRWRLSTAADAGVDGAHLSETGFDDSRWYAAVVPGTVLTTLIARGVYPDPDYGLNNLVIPDSLSRQDYWYRSTFPAPQTAADSEITLTFKGINYAADVWLNGAHLGAIKGAFNRGIFDITHLLHRSGGNALAVRISPPPHPGIPHEQSVAAGPGENGGNLALDGPTFVASEGWDWIPGIRDRNSGIWQEVEVAVTGKLRFGDPHVVTHLPLPRTDSADISITVPIENRSSASHSATVIARLGSIAARKTLTVAPGITAVTLDAREFPQLHLLHPRLWWPNGYGEANRYRLQLDLQDDAVVSDSTELMIGVRELTYELSLFDHSGKLRRVEVDPSKNSSSAPLIDVHHAAIKRTPGGWAESLTASGETSAAVHDIDSRALTPYLVIRVNGVPIAARGGSWGMDDSRKRISRAHLEPYFELHRAAHLNIIRNWLGQDTEEVFYDLADEYGLLVLNDFWASTQDFQLEPDDPALFLANARDVISRYRNHPSIAVWFGRNEGVPQPTINEGLDDLVATLDGTRYYTGSSNSVNLQGSGPYNYRPPEQYFTELAKGFSVEVGTPSLSTLEALRASIPEADRWPLGDTYAYHDWHFGGNGDIASFHAALAVQYGAATDLEDFERKAQLMDYVSYRAIFEGFQAHLWTENSGRLLWMTHPSWPSNTWQIYSSDYDTAAAYYAVKKACEPVHVQMNLPDFKLAIANTSQTAREHLTLRSRILTLDNHLLAERIDTVNAAANSVLTLPQLDLARWFKQQPLLLVKLSLTDSHGTLLSDNLYWQGKDAASQQRLNELSPQPVSMTAVAHGTRVSVTLKNQGSAAVLSAKITVLDAAGTRVLPVYYDDNYIGLLPGESRRIDVQCPQQSGICAKVALRGWDVQPQSVDVL